MRCIVCKVAGHMAGVSTQEAVLYSLLYYSSRDSLLYYSSSDSLR